MEWRKNRIAIGAVVFVALLGLTLWATNRQERQPTSSAEVPTMELDKDTITTIEVTRPEGDAVVLSKVEGAWRVTAPLDAEADNSNVESALNRLGDLQITRVVATRPENYQRLQVDEANAVRVIVKAGEETLTQLAIGKYADGMTMMRIDDRTEVFGAGGSLRYAFDRELKAWRNRKVVSVESSSVQSIRFESPNGTFQFDRVADEWTASTGAKELGDFDSKKVAGVVSTAARLIATGFAAEDVSAPRAGLNEPKASVTLTVSDDPEPIVLELGDTIDEPAGAYLWRKGNPVIFVVSEYLANRLQPDAKAFEKLDEPPPPPAMQAPPQDQGQPRLPPEVMRQLQEQILKQQQQQQR